MINNIFLGLGSNIGEKTYNMNKAIELLKADERNFVLQVSSFVETKSLTDDNQPDYLNAVLEMNTLLTPQELLVFTQKIERDLGRTQKGKKAPRTMDIDILFYAKEIICEDNLIIPHPLCHERLFVLAPFIEIAPHFRHPILRKKIKDLYKKLAV
jgi:2-amino-4-hydroxy-6-hydroxymethyldihydropteridine diphosphokinase